MRALILCLLAAVLLFPFAYAQEAPPSPSEPPAASAAPGDPHAPVSVPEPSELAPQRYASGNILWVINQLWALIVPCIFLFTGLSVALRTRAARVAAWPWSMLLFGALLVFTYAIAWLATLGPWLAGVLGYSESQHSFPLLGVLLLIVPGLAVLIPPSRVWLTKQARKAWPFGATIALYLALFVLIDYLLNWPLSFYQGYIREHSYGLSNQSFGKWFGDDLKGLGVTIVAGSLFLWIPFLLLKKSPRRWWLYTAALVPVFMFFVMFVNPILIDPLFNEFGPMQNKELEAKILATAERAGIEGSRVYEVNKSVDTNAVNAYVTGFMGSKRIVLWDTLLAKLDEDEVLFVMGHEMGHYVLGHVVRGIAFISVLLLAALYLVHRLSGAIITRYQDRIGFTSLADVASLPLILLMIQVFSLVATPLILAHSRHNEHEADRFGIELLRNNRAAATGFVKLQTENLAVPWHGLLYTLWRDSHPSIGKRITFFNEYRPWDKGEPLYYEHHIKKD